MSGRIAGLEQYFEPEDYFIVGLEFTSLIIGDKRAQFRAELVGPLPHEDGRVDLTGVNREPTTSSGLDIVDAASGEFRVRGGRLRLTRGQRLIWKTWSRNP